MKTNKYLIFWVLNGTMKMGTQIVTISGVMNTSEFNGLQKKLRKQHGKNLCIQAFSKFEGKDLPVIDVTKI
jgi:hypothetical protein